MKLSIIALFSTVAGLANAGGFQNSCRDIFVAPPSKNIEAQCRTKDGRWRWTNFDLNAVLANVNGQLVRRKWGYYGRRCKNQKWNGLAWIADCQTPQGNYVTSSIRIADFISSNDGCLADNDLKEYAAICQAPR